MSTVLVVDDNKKIVSVLADYLEAAGFSTLTAFDGASALDVLANTPPDLALLDVMLPAVDGLELTRRFVARDIPVILVTARVEEGDRLIGLELGADDYIVKPFSPREVVARVRAVLRRAARADSVEAPISVGDLVVDPHTRNVIDGERSVVLTRTEFDILAAMAASPGRVFTRAQLLGVCGSEYFEGYERTVDAHIKNIRKKLCPEKDAGCYIRTVIGVGYKVEPR